MISWSIELGGKYFPAKRFTFNLQEGKRIIMSTSGGADSAILLYIAAKLNLEHGNPSELINVQIRVEEHQTNHIFSESVVRYVNHLLGTNLNIPYQEGWEYAEIDNFHEKLVMVKNPLTEKYQVDEFIMGNTKNPPDDVFVHGRIFRPEMNGNPYYEDAVYAPFADFDKRYVIDLYSKLERFDLLALTHSCDINTNMEYCGSCCQCDEREWAFRENRLIDPAPRKFKDENICRL
jgi:hypothetical protein